MNARHVTRDECTARFGRVVDGVSEEMRLRFGAAQRDEIAKGVMDAVRELTGRLSAEELLELAAAQPAVKAKKG